MGIFDRFKKNNNKKEGTIGAKQEIPRQLVNNPEDVKALLDKEIEGFFPRFGALHPSCYKRSMQVCYQNLPCNIDDREWLGRLLQSTLRQRLNVEVPLYSIDEYIKNSPYFEELRHNYELEIVRWEIENILRDGEMWITRDEFGGRMAKYGANWDRALRCGVVDTLLAIGMNKEAIEEGLEAFADMWQDHCMQKSFDNEYEPNYAINLIATMEPADEGFRANWMTMRKFQYYIEHKDSVDKYGTITPEMKMSVADAQAVAEVLSAQIEERENYLKLFREYGSKLAAQRGEKGNI